MGMRKGPKELFVVGDRVLVDPGEGEHRTKVGLLLPAGAVEKEEVRGGTIVAVGPGTPLPPPQDETEPWKKPFQAPRYLPMEVEIGDYALFFRKAAIEIAFEGSAYLVVPYGAILVLVRAGTGSGLPDAL